MDYRNRKYYVVNFDDYRHNKQIEFIKRICKNAKFHSIDNSKSFKKFDKLFYKKYKNKSFLFYGIYPNYMISIPFYEVKKFENIMWYLSIDVDYNNNCKYCQFNNKFCYVKIDKKTLKQ